MIPKTSDFFYTLPPHKIALYPLDKRESSKLLLYHKREIKDGLFKNIVHHLSPDNLIIFNKTRVVNARIIFYKNGISPIEIFCIEPVFPSTEISQAFIQKNKVSWKCLIGGAKKWKDGTLEIEYQNTTLKVMRKGVFNDLFLVEFEWDNVNLTFGDILEIFGKVPLPPYIKRNTETIDKERYQTVYAQIQGSVAAPTAGLHFTQELIDEITSNKTLNCKTNFVTLHVSAGTFKPLSTDIQHHIMHAEHISVGIDVLKNIKQQLTKGPVTAVGTTSLRTLESIYWLGVQILRNKNPKNVEQFQPYNEPSDIPSIDAVEAIENHLLQNKLDIISAITSLMIVPGYKFRIVNALLTNFHQPNSTLLALVSAFIGEDWKKVYAHALNNDYRFLSYGDACYFRRD